MSIEDKPSMLDLINVERKFEWRKWAKEIPYIQWPSDWLVKAVPPMLTGIIRYWITKNGLKSNVSVYLDCYGLVGAMNQPYWEIYPIDSDVHRCLLHETDELLEVIKKALEQIK